MKSVSLHGSINQSITNQLIIMESLCGRGLFLERGEGPVGEGREGLSTFFIYFFCITGIKIVFGLVFLVYFSKMFVVVVDSFLIFFFIVSCHAPFDSKFIIHKRQITQFDEFFFLSIRFF